MKIPTYAFFTLLLFGVQSHLQNHEKPSGAKQLGLTKLSCVYQDTLLANRDQRFLNIRHTHLHYSMPMYKTLEDWLKRAEELRTHIWITAGLWPQPEKTPLNPHIFERFDREGYTVEKVYFESYPNFYVTGNLYKPKGKNPPFPAIISPHGHWRIGDWRSGRLNNDEKCSVPGRCINFAKQGYVVFSYSMVGYNDSQQLDHKYGGEERLHLWGINLLGLQLWNSIRAVDFISSLPEVDKERIACTGASGGGTQTFMLAAVDDRIKVAAPVNMISAIMQGGCLCENAPLLRLNTFNVEIAALTAPRPLLMVSTTTDQSKNTLEDEYPAIREIYRLYNAESKLSAVRFDAPHNYNRQSREAVYSWFGRWLLNETKPENLKEVDFKVEKDEDLLVFAKRPMPAEALDREGFTAMLIGDRRRQLQEHIPQNREILKKMREVIGTAMQHTLAVSIPSPSDLFIESRGTIAFRDYEIQRLLIGRKDVGDRIPAILYLPKTKGKRISATLMVHPSGKAAMIDSLGAVPCPLVRQLVNDKQAVLVIDCFNTGEHALPGCRKTREEGNPHFTTFNRTDLALRVQDIITSIVYLQNRKNTKRVNLLGLESAGLWCLLARSQVKDVNTTVIDANQFDCRTDSTYLGEMYIPNLRRVGDFAMAGALIAPGKLIIQNIGKNFPIDIIQKGFDAIDAGDKLIYLPGLAEKEKIINWLCEN